MDRKFALGVGVVTALWAGALVVQACSGCGCSVKKSATDCESGVCAVTDAAKLESAAHGEHLSTEQMKVAVASANYIILDARGDQYFNGELIPGAERMASATEAAEILKRLPDMHAEIITYCSNVKCPASKKLADKLKALGYTHVHEYPEGLAGWKAAGNAVEATE